MERFIQKRVLELASDADILNAFVVGQIGADAAVGQSSTLTDGDELIVRRICARIVICKVLAEPTVHGQKSVGVEQMRPSGSDVE